MDKLTQESLKKVLDYNPETGVFTSLVNRGKGRAGVAAGFVRKDGYVRIRIDHLPYFAHRLAWLYVTGSFPVGEIDHLDGDRSNNRIANLRDVSREENGRNRKLSSNNKSGYQGVRFVDGCNRWQARIRIDGRNRNLGTYDTPEIAHEAYARAAKDLGYSYRHIYGEA